MRVAVRKENNGHLIVDVVDVETWEDFDGVSESIIEKFTGVVIRKHDGPEGSRRWTVSFDRVELLFDFVDMVGMSIRVPESGSGSEALAMRISEFLKGLSYSCKTL